MAKASFDLQKDLASMEDDLPGSFIECPSHGLHLVSVPLGDKSFQDK
jgi:hypothetical protein